MVSMHMNRCDVSVFAWVAGLTFREESLLVEDCDRVNEEEHDLEEPKDVHDDR